MDCSKGDRGFLDILEELHAMHAKKGADYGTSADPYANMRAAADMGVEPWRCALMRANEKLTRLKAFCVKGTLANESAEDSMLDGASYLIIALRLFRESQGVTQDGT